MLKQKIYAIIMFLFSIWMLSKGIGTLAVVTLPISIFLFFSKFDYMNNDY